MTDVKNEPPADDQRELSFNPIERSCLYQVRSQFMNLKMQMITWRPLEYKSFCRQTDGTPATMHLLGRTLGARVDIEFGVAGDGGSRRLSNYYASWRWRSPNGSNDYDNSIEFKADGTLLQVQNLPAVIATFCTEVLLIKSSEEIVEYVPSVLQAHHALFVGELAASCRHYNQSPPHPDSSPDICETYRRLDRVLQATAAFAYTK